MTSAAVKQEIRSLCDQHKWQQAEPLLQQLLNTGQPDAETWYLLAGLQGAKGQFAEAEASCRRALELDAAYTEARFRLANALDAQGRKDEALAHYEAMLEASPEFAHGWNNAGVCLQSMRRYDEAADCFRRAVKLEPAVADFHVNLALASIQSGEMEIAYKAIEAAFTREMPPPQQVYAATLLGMNLLYFGYAAEAEQMYRRALAPDPAVAESHVNLGLALQAQHRLDEARACFEQALQLDTRHAAARLARARVLLQQADYGQAWADYESRPLPAQCDPVSGLDAAALKAKTVLLQQEERFGDTLFFLRFVPLLVREGARVTVQCDPALVSLCRAGLDASVQVISSAQAAPECDRRMALGSLAALFSATPAQVDAAGYLQAETAKSPQITQAIAEKSAALKIGFAWSGDSEQAYDLQRSMPLDRFAALFDLPGTAFFSLQPHGAQPAIAQLLEAYRVQNLAPLLNDFSATAAAISQLDMVVTVDTALAHLAGALGVKGVICLPYAPNWCWGLGQERSPWYPSLRLLRQPRPGDWDSVMQQAVKVISAG